MTSIFLSPPSFNDFVVNNKGNDMPLGNKTKDVCHYGTRFSGGTKINDAYLWIKVPLDILKKSSEVHIITLHNCRRARWFQIIKHWPAIF